jgi:hypothetical protein
MWRCGDVEIWDLAATITKFQISKSQISRSPDLQISKLLRVDADHAIDRTVVFYVNLPDALP